MSKGLVAVYINISLNKHQVDWVEQELRKLCGDPDITINRLFENNNIKTKPASNNGVKILSGWVPVSQVPYDFMNALVTSGVAPNHEMRVVFETGVTFRYMVAGGQLKTSLSSTTHMWKPPRSVVESAKATNG